MCVRALVCLHSCVRPFMRAQVHAQARMCAHVPTAAAGITYHCQDSFPTGCTATCGNAGVRTTTRTCISSAGQAVDAHFCGNCVTSSVPCPAVAACLQTTIGPVTTPTAVPSLTVSVCVPMCVSFAGWQTCFSITGRVHTSWSAFVLVCCGLQGLFLCLPASLRVPNGLAFYFLSIPFLFFPCLSLPCLP